MLRLEHISKYFPGVKALQRVSLEINPGEVHALCGENGAGKSTLMHIIMGNLQPDEGALIWHGKPIVINSVLRAQELGIGIVYQEKSLVDSLSIAENIFPVHQPVNSFGLINKRALFQKARRLLNELQLEDLDPKSIAGKLSATEKSMVEIAKALAKNPSLLILDEPTASITHRETKVLFRLISQLKTNGVAIIYISHRMAEIKQIADVVSVLKDGQYQGTVPGEVPTEQIIRMMVGRELGSAQYCTHVRPGVKLEAKSLSGKGFHNISFKIAPGEILGFAGLSDSGRSELARAIFGDTNITSGELFINGRGISLRHPGDSMREGIAYLPESRKTDGLFMEKSIAENISSVKMQAGFYDRSGLMREADMIVRKFNIRTSSVKNTVGKLSGGNQQKVVIAKWLSTNPDVFIVNEPTNGVDVGAKSEIYQILKELTASGKSILLISGELPELLLLSNRIAVMYSGSIKDILSHEEATEDKIMALASGIAVNHN